MALPIVPLDNDVDIDGAILRKNTSSRAIEAAAGLTGITAKLSSTDGGAAINAALSVTATEAAGLPGTYVATFQGDDLRTYAASYAGQVCYVVFGDSSGNVLGSKPVKIGAIRRF